MGLAKVLLGRQQAAHARTDSADLAHQNKDRHRQQLIEDQHERSDKAGSPGDTRSVQGEARIVDGNVSDSSSASELEDQHFNHIRTDSIELAKSRIAKEHQHSRLAGLQISTADVQSLGTAAEEPTQEADSLYHKVRFRTRRASASEAAPTNQEEQQKSSGLLLFFKKHFTTFSSDNRHKGTDGLSNKPKPLLKLSAVSDEQGNSE